MNRILFVVFLLSAGLPLYGQLAAGVEMKIVRAEDARRYDSELEQLLTDRNADVRTRAALAAGRIGHENAVGPLTSLLNDTSAEVRAMAAFALGETESLKAADAILAVLNRAGEQDNVRARAVEAAGKVAAAHAGPPNTPVDKKDPKVVDLGNALLDALEAEEAKRDKQNGLLIRLGLAAALRARPEGAESVVVLYLTNLDPSVRADAANTMARIRGKSANAALRAMLMSDENAVARANAARALGAAEDKESVNILITAATEDDDSRVRVSAIRSLALLRDPFAVDKLLEHGEKLLSAFQKNKRPGVEPAEKSELLEIAAALGRLVPKTNDARTVRFLTRLGTADDYSSPETEIAFARIAPKLYTNYLKGKKDAAKKTRQAAAASLEGIREFAALGQTADEIELRAEAVEQLRKGLTSYRRREALPDVFSMPDLLRAYAAFKPDGLDAELRHYLADDNIFIRATAASLIADLPVDRQNTEALKAAFTRALQSDKAENDAQLGILEAIYKLDKNASVGTLFFALDAPDYLVRKRAFEMLSTPEVLKGDPQIEGKLANARKEHRDQVLLHSPASGTKLGQVLNTVADYRRAVARRNGTVKAVFTTHKGIFTIDLLPDDAPLTVDNFVKLARAKYFNGLAVHRVVPNFVMQDGDPRGDGNGGPGWSIRCEINMVPFERGAVGMALSGKDTGGSQWFATHSPQPHLDGGYTVFGKVNEKDMSVVDRIVRGDKILSVRIVEGTSSPRQRKK